MPKANTYLWQEWQQSTEAHPQSLPRSWPARTWCTWSPPAPQRWSLQGKHSRPLCQPDEPPPRSSKDQSRLLIQRPWIRQLACHRHRHPSHPFPCFDLDADNHPLAVVQSQGKTLTLRLSSFCQPVVGWGPSGIFTAQDLDIFCWEIWIVIRALNYLSCQRSDTTL